MLFISIRERTGGGKDQENDPKGKDSKRLSGKKVILRAAGEWRKERTTPTAEQATLPYSYRRFPSWCRMLFLFHPRGGEISSIWLFTSMRRHTCTQTLKLLKEECTCGESTQRWLMQPDYSICLWSQTRDGQIFNRNIWNHRNSARS